MSSATTTWGLGDYPAMAERLVDAATLVVDRARIGADDRVLDLGCGTGNAAIGAAQRGAARVVGVDIEPRLLEIARRRAIQAGVEVEWRCADAADPAIGEGGYSAVVSVFGVMYVPDHDGAAAALARACEPGGRIVLAAWSPDSLLPAFGAALAPYLPPPPPGGAPPARWGDPESVGELLARHGLEVSGHSPERLGLTFDDRAQARDFLLKTAGHVIAERERLRAEGRWEDLLAEVDRLVAERDQDAGRGTSLPLDYLVVEASRPDRRRASPEL